MTSRRLAVALALTLLFEIALFSVLFQHSELGAHTARAQWLMVLGTPAWVLTLVLVSRLRLSRRTGALLILGVSVVFYLIAMTHGPTTSDDDYRYVWDAKVQLSGTDPYRYPPASPQLTDLREPFLFGAPDHCLHQFPGGCTSINRPTVRTIYPPVAEAAFAAMRVASFGGHGGHLPLQIAAALGCLLVSALLLRAGRPVWQAAVWGWCPVTVVEFANNAHIDWLACLLIVFVFVSTKRTAAIGALVGAAIAVKLYPALVLPALMRRNWFVAVVAVAFVALVYVPHVLAVGSDVIGYLPGYLKENQYGSGERLLLLGAVLPSPLDTIVGALLLLGISLWAWLRAPAGEPARAAVLVVGVAFCVVTPSYGWYAGMLIVLVALTGAVEWLPIAFAATFAYLIHTDHDSQIYFVALAATLLIAAFRHRDNLRRCLPSSSPTTGPSPSSPSIPRR
ncbi:MAG: glycosyltransferase 87 family protein [Jatrophihabitans sp.]